MYCVNCGAEIENTATFCPYCGAKVANNQQESQSAPRVDVIPNTRSVEETQKRPSGQPKLTMAITGTVLGVMGLFFSIIPYFPGFVMSIVGIVLCAVALKAGLNARRNNGPLSLGTIITGAVGLGTSIFMLIFSLMFFFMYLSMY